MQSTRLIKRRIKTTQNIRQITKAMQMVSASKMRRAQSQAQASKPYALKLHEVLQRVASRVDQEKHPLLKQNQTGDQLIVLIGSDKGLTGGMNTNLFRGTEKFLEELKPVADRLQFIGVGKKSGEFVAKMGYNLVAEFSELPDKLSLEDTLPVSNMIMEGYLKGEYQNVYVIFMNFISTLKQEIAITHLLPLQLEDPEPEFMKDTVETESGKFKEYLFEPKAEEILDWILPYFTETIIYQTILDAKASEHSARMVAMKNATDNAQELIGVLTLEYNKSRQASITNELLDMLTASVVSG